MSSSRAGISLSLNVVIKSSNSDMSLRSRCLSMMKMYNPYMGMGMDRVNEVQNVHVCTNVYLGFLQ